MSDDVRDLLAEAAPEPSRQVDVATIAGAARRRRVVRRGLAAVSALALVAVVTGGVLALGTGGSTTVAVRSESPTSSIPDGWKVVSADGAGVSLAVPPGWGRTAAGDVANEVLTVGTAERPGAGPIAACMSTSAPSTVDGTWVSLFEYPSGSTSFVDPFGGNIAVPANLARPADFRGSSYLGVSSCGTSNAQPTSLSTSTVPPTAVSPANRFEEYVFTDAGRLFLARIVTIGNVETSSAISLGQQVLNTFHVDPVAGTTTTSSEPATTTTAPDATTNATATTTLPAAGASSDEQAIRAAFLGWLDTPARDQVDQFVEDLASIRDAVRQGMAQHTPQDLAGFSGRVDAVHLVDASHADVTYTLLQGGQDFIANQVGHAVKINGTWKVTRETECALLTFGGITCPARTTPVP